MHDAFAVHTLNEEGKLKAQAIATAFDQLVQQLTQVTPQPCREMSIVITKLEEAAFFAKKGMAKLNSL